MHAERVCKEINNVGEYHNLFLKVIYSDVFENFRKMNLEIYQLDPTKFLSAPELAWQVSFKKTDLTLELLTDIGMLLMGEKETKGRICHSVKCKR